MNAAERFKALRIRASEAALANKKEVVKENKQQRKSHESDEPGSAAKARAAFELAKLEAEEAGEDFDRKRAWDWTIEESEKWDQKVQEKSANKQTASFNDFASAADRAYQNDRKHFEPDLTKYKNEKQSNPEGKVDFSSRPSKESIDKLVDHIQKGDEQRMKRRKPKEDETGVSYINEKNKRFNERLNKHYDKYTKEIRDSLERGTSL